MAAFEVLSEICQEFGDELVNGPVGSFPVSMHRILFGPSKAVML